MVLAFAVFVLTCLVPGCSRSKEGNDEGDAFFLDQERSTFAADADADTYSGPAPLTVHFTAHMIGARGAASYQWNFDDHTAGHEQNPVHTFRKHGWYLVTMDARDGAGHTYRMNLQLHAWRPSDWDRMLSQPDQRIVLRALRELKAKRRRAASAASASMTN